jgi:CheY-like chemotaxis protein
VARPRVILSCKDAEAAVKMIGSLNPKRYRVEHLQDLNEALLRAELVLAHALVIHVPSTGLSADELLKRCRGTAERVTPVLLSPSPEVSDVATQLGGRFLDECFEVPSFKRAVYRAVSKTEDRRQRQHPHRRQVRRRPKQRVVLLTTQAASGAVIAAVLRNQLGVACEVATSGQDALQLLGDATDCFVAQVHMLITTESGAAAARELARRGIPVIPLKEGGGRDPSEAGQAAWDIVPQVRRSLTARDHLARQHEGLPSGG